MKVITQTTLTPRMIIYDSSKPSTPADKADKAIMTSLKSFLNPVILVTDDEGNTLYKQGEFYTPWVFYTVITLASLAGGYLLFSFVGSKVRK